MVTETAQHHAKDQTSRRPILISLKSLQEVYPVLMLKSQASSLSLSDLSTCNVDDDDESQERPAPTVLFTAADDSQEKKDDQSSPKEEAHPMDSGVPVSS